MGGVKRMLEEVAEQMGIDDPNDPKVKAEVVRLHPSLAKGNHKPDRKDMITTKAEELADQRYGREFNDLSPSLQMQVWMEAEQEAADYFACQADAIYDRMREDGYKK